VQPAYEGLLRNVVHIALFAQLNHDICSSDILVIEIITAPRYAVICAGARQAHNTKED